MSGKLKVYSYKKINRLVQRLRDDLSGGGQDFVLLYAFNGTGKTRLTKDLFKRILNAFLERYQFDLPELAALPTTTSTPTPTEPS